ncbi:MAG: glycosyltransferase family 4 protein [Gloeobacterales cyanobacterium]
MGTEEKLSILFHVSRYWPAIAGAALHTRELTHHLAQHHQVVVVRHCGDEPSSAEIAFAHNQSYLDLDKDYGVPIYQVGPGKLLKGPIQTLTQYHASQRLTRLLYSTLARSTVASQLRSLDAPYQLIHAVYTGLACTVEAAQQIAKEKRIPFVLTPLLHFPSKEKEADADPQFQRLYQKADALIAMTQFEREWLMEKGGAKPERVHVCPIGPLVNEQADPSTFRKEYDLEDALIVLFIARQIAYKGYRHLCEAATSVWAKYPDTYFVFLGPPTEESQAYFDQFSDSRFINLGEVSSEVKSSALAACDVLCVPSTEESLGAIYLEAWSFKKPVIAADIPAMHSVISQEEDGLIVPQDPKALSHALIRLLADDTLRSRMGEAGYRKVHAQYDWDVIANRLLNIYRGLLA